MAAIKKLIRRILKLIDRYPWVIPLFGFVSGVASFLLVERKQEQFAQLISVLMLAGWVWIALENLMRRGISEWFGITLPSGVFRFVSQLIHQESLFFVIPFFFITTAWNTGQVIFTSLLIVIALVSLIDPIYYRWLAPRRWLYYSFHGITLFAALLTALPLLFHLPTPQSYLWSLGIAVLLTCPGLVRSMSVAWWRRLLAIVALIVIVSGIGIAVRPWIPPASLWLTEVAITDHLSDESRSPAQKLKVVTQQQLNAGIYAFTAIHAPRGLNERIYHQWRHNGKNMDKIPLNISGGREEGYRSWSHKKNFPADSTGDWQIYVMTEANQIIGILRFQVVNAADKQEPTQKGGVEYNQQATSVSADSKASVESSVSPVKAEAPNKDDASPTLNGPNDGSSQEDQPPTKTSEEASTSADTGESKTDSSGTEATPASPSP